MTPLVMLDGALLTVGGSLTTDPDCCCTPTCTTIESSSGGEGTTVNTHTFPPEENDLQFEYEAYYVPDSFEVFLVEEDGELVFATDGQVSGNGTHCFTKPEGVTDIVEKLYKLKNGNFHDDIE